MKRKTYLLALLALVGCMLFPSAIKAQDDVMMQAFYWNVPVDEANKNGTWWDNLASKADDMAESGITAIWIPSPAKANYGITDNGYGIYDHYDLGNYNQKGTVETRFGSRAELENMIAAMHNTNCGKRRVDVYVDMILNHVIVNHHADPTINNLEVNPVVKKYVFDEAKRGPVQYVPYPTNEIHWVIPNAQPGDYYIKVKGYQLNYDADKKDRGYDIEIDYANTGYNGNYSWESEPNNGMGNTDDFGASGRTMRGYIDYNGDIDEYKVTLTTAGKIEMKLAARKQYDDGGWGYANQNNGYYPFEIWYNGKNLATDMECQTFTHVHYPNHTGVGEKNYSWHYNHFHPVDDNDFLTGWDWYKTAPDDAPIVPNTKGFGNDFNTFDPVVQNRLKDWGVWLSNQIGIDGYRLDFVRGFQVEYAADWINNLPLKNGNQPFIVGEYWGPGYRLEEWVEDLESMGADGDVFDFPLREDLKRICMDDNYEMHWLNQAGMVRGPEFNLPGNSVVTWLDNHDTGKEWDKWVTRDWWMAYAYMLTHEGRPCLFYPHYYGGTLESGHNGIHKQITVPSMKNAIDDLMFIRRTYLGGTLEVLTATGNPWPSDNTRNVYVARRQGNGTKDGGIVVMNNSYETKGVWVTVNASGFSNWSNKTLVNAFTGETTPVYSDGRAWLEAPQRGYSVFVLASDYMPISDPTTEPKSVETPGEIVPAVADFNLSVYPNPVNAIGSLSINSKTDVNVTVDIYNKMGQNVAKLYQGELNAGVNTFSLSDYELSAGTYFVKVSNGSNVITSQLVIL